MESLRKNYLMSDYLAIQAGAFGAGIILRFARTLLNQLSMDISSGVNKDIYMEVDVAALLDNKQQESLRKQVWKGTGLCRVSPFLKSAARHTFDARSTCNGRGGDQLCGGMAAR